MFSETYYWLVLVVEYETSGVVNGPLLCGEPG